MTLPQLTLEQLAALWLLLTVGLMWGAGWVVDAIEQWRKR